MHAHRRPNTCAAHAQCMPSAPQGHTQYMAFRTNAQHINPMHAQHMRNPCPTNAEHVPSPCQVHAQPMSSVCPTPRHQQVSDDEKLLTVLHQGSCFGEIALFTEKARRTASMVSAIPSACYFLHRRTSKISAMCCMILATA